MFSSHDTLDNSPEAALLIARSRELAAGHIEGLKAFLAERTRAAIEQYIAQNGVELKDPWPVNFTARNQKILLDEFIQIHLDWLSDCNHDNAANYIQGEA